VPCNFAKLGEMLDDFHKQPVSFLPWPVTRHQFRINGVLCGLRVLADGEGDEVRGATPQVVTDEINAEGGAFRASNTSSRAKRDRPPIFLHFSTVYF